MTPISTGIRNSGLLSRTLLSSEMEPGDALFIPSMWWHHVEGLDSLNVLINYWWRQSPAYHALACRRAHACNCSQSAICRTAQKEAWREILRHYVFDADESTVAHIPEHCRGMLGPMDDTNARRIRAELLNKLNR